MSDEQLETELHRRAVRARVERAVRAGMSELFEVLRECDGADPELVEELLRDVRQNVVPRAGATDSVGDSGWTYLLPAANPENSQWWFASSGIDYLHEKTRRALALHGDDSRIACLGTPSLAGVLGPLGSRLSVLDIDSDVLSAVSKVARESEIHEYNANNTLPDGLVGQFAVCVLDPPWYPEAIRCFLSRGLELLREGGELFSTLPGALTRPALHRFRAQLISDVASAGHEVLGLESACLRYQVPAFEQAALRNSAEFRGVPWRTGDLVWFRKSGPKGISFDAIPVRESRSFTRAPNHFRVFIGESSERSPKLAVKRLDNYSAHISRRAHAGEVPDVWSSEKVGLAVGDLEATRRVLVAWEQGESREAFLHGVDDGPEREAFEELARRLDEELGLWAVFGSAPPLRSQDQIEETKRRALSEYATPSSSREHLHAEDGYRAAYSRDRDRVLWSSGLRRLSDKTQLFPATYDDDLRRRLTHSIEVLQLATTIGESFGLNRDLIEAGALAHDIGHTPFGHAGEFALHRVLNDIHGELGFNHYEHGVDVVRFLEGPYHVSNGTGFHGLNLTPEVAECVLKHTYCHGGEELWTSETVWTKSKHQSFVPRGYCHLEGQAVRAADKISYLISDLEDGIRLGAIKRHHLLQCRFFHRPPLRFEDLGQELGHQFLQQRRKILRLLMEDLIQASSKRLARTTDLSPAGVRKNSEYLLQHSDDVLADMREIWERIQKTLLHADRRVVSANLHAGRIVSVLAVSCALLPELLDRQFVREYERLNSSQYMEFYRGTAGKRVTIPAEMVAQVPVSTLVGGSHKPGTVATVDVPNLVMAKDYVAGLTDSRARAFYGQLMNGEATLGR